jgi:hypothetical protein
MHSISYEIIDLTNQNDSKHASGLFIHFCQTDNQIRKLQINVLDKINDNNVFIHVR